MGSTGWNLAIFDANGAEGKIFTIDSYYSYLGIASFKFEKSLIFNEMSCLCPILDNSDIRGRNCFLSEIDSMAFENEWIF